MNCGVSTVAKAVYKVTRAICHVFHNFCTFPNTIEGLREISAGFYKRGALQGGHGIPQIVGAVDGTHVVIRNPIEADGAHFNRKGYTSLNVHAICDHKGRFFDVFTGSPGSMHDSRVMENSPFARELSGRLGRLFWSGRSLINGVQVPFQIIADSAYPCKTFILPALRDTIAGQSVAKGRFNRRVAATRNVVERAFGRLKARWRVLLKQNDLSLKHVNFVIMACFCLHNICEERNERCPEVDAELRELLEAYNAMFPTEREVSNRHAGSINVEVNADADVQGYNAMIQQDPSHDAPLPGNERMHGSTVRDAIVGLVSQRFE